MVSFARATVFPQNIYITELSDCFRVTASNINPTTDSVFYLNALKEKVYVDYESSTDSFDVPLEETVLYFEVNGKGNLEMQFPDMITSYPGEGGGWYSNVEETTGFVLIRDCSPICAFLKYGDKITEHGLTDQSVEIHIGENGTYILGGKFNAKPKDGAEDLDVKSTYYFGRQVVCDRFDTTPPTIKWSCDDSGKKLKPNTESTLKLAIKIGRAHV